MIADDFQNRLAEIERSRPAIVAPDSTIKGITRKPEEIANDLLALQCDILIQILRRAS